MAENKTSNGLWSMDYVSYVAQLNAKKLRDVHLQGYDQDSTDDENKELYTTKVRAYCIQGLHRKMQCYATHFLDLIVSDTGVIYIDDMLKPYARNARLWIRPATTNHAFLQYSLDVDIKLFANEKFGYSIDYPNVTEWLHNSSPNMDTSSSLSSSQGDYNHQTSQSSCSSHNSVQADATRNMLEEAEIQLVDVEEHAKEIMELLHLDFSKPKIANENMRRVLVLTEYILNLPTTIHRWGYNYDINNDQAKVLKFRLKGLNFTTIVGETCESKLHRIHREIAYTSDIYHQWLRAYLWLAPVIMARFDENIIAEREARKAMDSRTMPSHNESKKAAEALRADDYSDEDYKNMPSAPDDNTQLIHSNVDKTQQHPPPHCIVM